MIDLETVVKVIFILIMCIFYPLTLSSWYKMRNVQDGDRQSRELSAAMAFTILFAVLGGTFGFLGDYQHNMAAVVEAVQNLPTGTGLKDYVQTALSTSGPGAYTSSDLKTCLKTLANKNEALISNGEYIQVMDFDPSDPTGIFFANNGGQRMYRWTLQTGLKDQVIDQIYGVIVPRYTDLNGKKFDRACGFYTSGDSEEGRPHEVIKGMGMSVMNSLRNNARHMVFNDEKARFIINHYGVSCQNEERTKATSKPQPLRNSGIYVKVGKHKVNAIGVIVPGADRSSLYSTFPGIEQYMASWNPFDSSVWYILKYRVGDNASTIGVAHADTNYFIDLTTLNKTGVLTIMERAPFDFDLLYADLFVQQKRFDQSEKYENELEEWKKLFTPEWKLTYASFEERGKPKVLKKLLEICPLSDTEKDVLAKKIEAGPVGFWASWFGPAEPPQEQPETPQHQKEFVWESKVKPEPRKPATPDPYYGWS